MKTESVGPLRCLATSTSATPFQRSSFSRSSLDRYISLR